MTNRKKYLVMGDGSSPHLTKWIGELHRYYDVFLISSRTIRPETLAFLKPGQFISLQLTLNPEGGNLSLLLKLPTIIRLINQWKPAIVNAHYITSYGFVAALARLFASHRFLLIQSAWGTDILVTPKKNIAYLIITRFALNQARLITSDAWSMTREIKKLTDKPTETFVFGIDRLPDVTILDKTPFLFFSNRALTPNYRIDRVVALFGIIVAEFPDARLVIANQGTEFENIRDLVSKLGLSDKITFVGFLNSHEQAGYYRVSQFYFSLPESDSTSVSLLEAMAWGCIPIVSDLEANHEWITNRENGLFETDCIRSDIQYLLDNRQTVFVKNRLVIQEKALFPELIAKFNHTIEQILTP